MSRSSKPERDRRLNAAFDLVTAGSPPGEAVSALALRFGLSRRQAYRYLLEARRLREPVAITLPTIPITIKLPEEALLELRAYAQSHGSTLSQSVAKAVQWFLEATRRHG